MVKTYNIFISHSWTHNKEYEGLKRLLDSEPYFDYKDYSVPRDDPIYGAKTDAQLKESIRNQMQPTSCILIMAGVYSTYSKWINIEIELAKQMGKRIIAVEGHGSERTSTIVKENADKVVKWNTSSIVDAIRMS